MKNKFEEIKNLIGNTPMLEIDLKYKDKNLRVFAKNESYNLSGSIKDRMVYYVLKKAYEDGSLKEGYYISEATSGNTGIAISAIGAILGHKVVIFMPDWMSDERKKLLKGYGADVRLVTFEEGGFKGSVEKTLEFKRENPNTFLPSQFTNENNVLAHYNGTGVEIIETLKKIDLKPDAIVAGVGTGGTIMGISRRLKEVNPNLKTFAVEPSQSPIMSDGIEGGLHRIEGIGDGFIPEIVKMDEIDRAIKIDDGDAVIMAQKLAAKGIGVGISSGANILASIEALKDLKDGSVVVTVLSDDNKKYLSTDLMKEITVENDFISKDVEIVNIRAYK